MALVLVVLGAFAVGGGVLLASPGTDGLALVGAGCFCAIVARLVQARRP